MSKYTEVKQEYDGFLSFLRRNLPEVDENQVLNYFVSAVCKIWGCNLLYSPDYPALLLDVTGEPYTMEQIVTAMGCCGDPERKLLVPDFFLDLVRRDLKSGNKTASKCIDLLDELFVGAAMVNGDFTTEEAVCLSEIMGGLVTRASREGLKISARSGYDGRITAKNDSSYLRNDSLLSKGQPVKKPVHIKNDEKPVKEDPPASGSSSTSLPLTINIRLVSENSQISQSESTQVSPLEEAPSVKKPSADDSETMESLLEELDGLVGLESVKKDVHSLMNFIKVTKIREKRGMKVPTISYHLVFTGNPGTGKTTVARLVAKLYYHMGILPQGQLVETDRSSLVAGYLGQTAIKTQKVIQQAMGGVLFIDEAYSLAGDTEDSYGKEAIETILKAMEDHRDELVVIVAGYTELMHKFIESNPGLSSRFSKYFEYPDYTGDELLAIFKRFCARNGYALDEEAEEMLRQKFDIMYENRDEHFGNARTARNIFEKAINAQADRIASQDSFSDTDLENITSADIRSAIGGVR